MKKIIALFVLIAIFLTSCAIPVATPSPGTSLEPTSTQQAQIANPASQNCIDQGGTLVIEERADLGEFGVCYFEDNRQCEEWALLRGDCPVGGVKVTGYITEAARYCAITGGTYAITGNSGADDEQGTCTFKNGAVCDVWDYYTGICDPATAPVAEWQTFTNSEAGFSIDTPPTWIQQALPDQGDGAIHGEAFTGTEGGVEVYWGVAFGGACTTGTVPVQLAQGKTTACYAKNSDGTETWSQIGYEASWSTSFSVRAYTSNAEQSSQDTVLKVLSTLTFTAPTTSNLTIQPLPMEVCNGQAQAMAHALETLVGSKTTEPIIPTQSEAPLEDWVNNASGSGCMATVTGTGEFYESPGSVVSALGNMLIDQGWTQDTQLQADGPTGTSSGYRKDNQICLPSAIWMPAESANCPKDQPITTCPLTPEQQLYTITLNCGVETTQGEAIPLEGSRLIVFDSTSGGDYRDLYTMDTNGMNMSRLTRGEANSFAGPWSPDGQRIVYTTFGLTNSFIALINADGTGQTTLSAIEGSDEAFPDWSPDGARIAFTSRRDGNNEIYLINADGSNPVRLTDNPADDFAPSWSPDGTQIVFVSDRDQQAGIYDLYIMNADGSGLVRLTNDTAIDYSPDWSPDGTRIVFRSHHDGPADIYVINVDGGGLTDLTNNPADDWAPQWSPDGSQVAFQTNRDGNWEIYRMAGDGSDLLNLTNNPADDQLPHWQP